MSIFVCMFSAELVLLIDAQQAASLAAYYPKIHDMWTMPMSEEEVRFRFLRWQNAYKMGKDYWQTSQYLEATINNIPTEMKVFLLVMTSRSDSMHAGSSCSTSQIYACPCPSTI